MGEEVIKWNQKKKELFFVDVVAESESTPLMQKEDAAREILLAVVEKMQAGDKDAD